MIQDWDEQRLARLCSEGDRRAEEELYTRYAARVYTLCRRYSGGADEAKDLMQDALLKALDRISTYTYTGRGSLYGWISRIAINLALNQIKRRHWRTVSLDIGVGDNLPEPSAQGWRPSPRKNCWNGFPSFRI